LPGNSFEFFYEKTSEISDICVKELKMKTIHITDTKIAAKIKQILTDKAHVHQKIREGKISEIDPKIKFVKAL